MTYYRPIFSLLAGVALIPIAANAQDRPQIQEQQPQTPVAETSATSGANQGLSATDAERLELAWAIVNIGFPVDQREDIFFEASDQLSRQMRLSMVDWITDEDARKMVDELVAKLNIRQKEVLRRHIPNIMSGLAASYANLFSKQELTDILAFAETPSGGAFLRDSSKLQSEPSFAAANQKHLDEVMAVAEEMMPEIMEKILSYKLRKQRE